MTCQNFKQIWSHLGEFWSKNHPKAAKNSPNRAKNNHIFLEMGRGDNACLFFVMKCITIVFSSNYFFWFWPSSRGNREVKVRPIVQTLSTSCFKKILNFSKILKTMFFSILTRPLMMKISTILGNIFGELVPKNPFKGPFCGCWISTQNFENF